MRLTEDPVNDRAPAQQTLTAVLVANPTHGQLTLKADGSFSYTPYASVSEDKFTYMASDGHGGAALATVIYIPLSPSPNLSLGIAHAGNFTRAMSVIRTPLS